MKRFIFPFPLSLKLSAVSLLITVWLCGCANRNDDSAGITTIGNTVAGTVADDKGVLVANAEVRLINADYNPANDPSEVGYLTMRSDSTGHFRFKQLKAGTYNLEATREGYAGYLPGVKLTGDHAEETAPAVVLAKPGAITVVFGKVKVALGGHFCMPGTTRHRRLDSLDMRLGSLTLPYVGAGHYASLRYQAQEESSGTEVLAPRTLDIAPGDTVIVLAEMGWAQVRRININTTATGANVMGNVGDVPVLVHLNAANFDFSLVRKDGGDIRFAKPNGSRLPYELAQWDPEARTAEIWVKVDTVRGNTRQQSIYLLSGNPDSTDAADGKAVFGGSIQGVWHFDSASLGNSVGGEDALNHGATLVDGVSGKAVRFRGNAWLDMPAKAFAGINRRITISFWQKSGDTLQSQPGDILGATDSSGDVVLRMHDPFGDSTVYFQAGALDAAPLDKVEKKTDAEADDHTRWNHWMLSKDADKGEMKIYLNGKVWAFANGKTASIGRVQSFALSFSGTDAYALDEFRVLRVAVGDDGAKLAYEIQKPGATALTLGK